jgi:toxin CcdB
MAQFDVYANPIPAQRERIPYWLDLQSNHIAQLDSRVIVPLRSLAFMGARIADLQPLVTVGGQQLCADVPAVASFPSRLLKKHIANIATQRHELITALDYLISGF